MINNGCCDLKYAIKLYDLGVKQNNNSWYWITLEIEGDIQGETTTFLNFGHNICHKYFLQEFSAFTCAELGEMLPNNISSQKDNSGKGFFVHDDCAMNFVEKTEANARAKMLIWLIKEGYIKVEELNVQL